jgi:uncharacterized protein YuzE
MRLTIDREADAAYVYVTEKSVARTRSLDENRLLDLDSDGEVRGIELLNISHGVELAGLPFPDEVSSLLRSNGIREYA